MVFSARGSAVPASPVSNVPSRNIVETTKETELPEYKIDVAPSVMQIMSEKCVRLFSCSSTIRAFGRPL